MKIAVCEDDDKYRARLVQQIKRGLKMGIPIDEYDTGDELLQAYEDGTRYDVLFMDIEMPGTSGTDTAYQIRQIDRMALFVFITCLPSHVREAFGVRALDYISKTVYTEDLQLGPVLERCMLEYMELNRQIPMDTDTGVLDVRIREIEYVESVNKKAMLHLSNGNTIHTNLNLKDSLAKLQAFDFERCHKSYLVNLWSIYDYTDTTIQTKSGAVIPVSRRLSNSIKQAKNKLNFKLI